MHRPKRAVNTLVPAFWLALALLAFHGGALSADGGKNPSRSLRVLCSTFPIYQITRNVAAGRNETAVDLMIPAAAGCPHDYALTPGDVAKLTGADVLVVNGLGMEDFLGDALARINPGIVVVDSSAGIAGLLSYDEGHGHDAEHRDGHEDDEDGGHGHAETNPHLFTSPLLTAKLAANIAERLGGVDPGGAALYAVNAAVYGKRLEKLAGEMAEAARGFANRRIAEPHGAFDYLARDLGLEVVVHLQPHGQELSAAQMLEVLEQIKKTKPALIAVEPRYPDRASRTLASETGLPVVELDPAASGPENAPLEYYETVMKANMETLETAMGSGRP